MRTYLRYDATWIMLLCFFLASGSWSEEQVNRLSPEEQQTLYTLYQESISSICWVYHGYHGEWIPGFSGTPCPEDGMIVVPTPNGGFALKRDVSWRERVVSATVSPAGMITYREKSDSQNQPLAPTVWPFKDQTGKLCAPKDGRILFAGSEAKETSPLPPANAIGWMFRTMDGSLVFPHRDIRPFPNIFWVVREGKGLAIIHSGPLEQGVFARVDEHYRITWLEPASPQNDAPSDEADYWPFVEDGTWLPSTGGQGGRMYPGMKNYA